MSEKLENKNKRRRGLPGPPLPCAAQQQQAGPARRRPSPPGPSSVVFLPDRGTTRARRARTAAPPPPASPGHLLLPPRRPGTPRTTPRSPDRPLTLPFLPPPLVLSSPSAPERSRRHRSPLPWPPASPRLPDMLPSSATTPSTSSPSHKPPDALCSRHRHRLPPRAPPSAAVDSPSPGLPRPRCAALRDRRELLPVSPLFSLPFPCRSAAPHHGRSLSPLSMSPPPSRPASAQTKPPFALLVPRGCRRAPQVASPCPEARSRSRPNSGRRPELRSGELRPPPLLPPTRPDAREPGLRPGALRRRPSGLWRGLRRVQRSPATSPRRLSPARWGRPVR